MLEIIVLTLEGTTINWNGSATIAELSEISVCVRIVIHRANDVVHNNLMSSIVGCAVSDK